MVTRSADEVDIASEHWARNGITQAAGCDSDGPMRSQIRATKEQAKRRAEVTHEDAGVTTSDS